MTPGNIDDLEPTFQEDEPYQWGEPRGNETLRQDARAMFAHRYQLVIKPAKDDSGSYVGFAMELRNVIGHGATHKECQENTLNAIVDAVVQIQENDGIPPQPAAERRVFQVNVRLTSNERTVLEQAAIANKITLSEYIRNVVLAEVFQEKQ